MNILSVKYLLFVLCAYLLHWSVPAKWRRYVLLCFSAIFLLFFGLFETALIVGYSLLAYYLARFSTDRKRFVLSVVLLLLPLLFNKYAGLFAEHFGLNESIGSFSFIGISFLSFKAISFAADSYKNKQDSDLISYLIYMLFFPVFLSGPIERVKSFGKELEKDKQMNWDSFVSSLFLLFYGMFIKMSVADRLFGIINYIYEHAAEYTQYSIVAILAYSLYIYADFAGYSYTARGVAKLFDIKINDNFRQPYLSFSIKEFWNRWHISLNEWLRDYVYIPLGGNRKGKMRKYINILIVFAISGIWHGAGLGFVIWGLLNGLFQIVGDLTYKFRNSLYDKMRLNGSLLQKLIRIAAVYLLISFTWIFFSQGFQGGLELISHLFEPRKFGVIEFALDFCAQTETSKQELLVIAFSVVFMITVDLLAGTDLHPDRRIMRSPVIVRYFALLILMLMVIAFGKYGHGVDLENFIYFKF